MSCPKQLSVVVSQIDETNYVASPAGGTGPYTYLWEIAQNGAFDGDSVVAISGDDTQPAVALNANAPAAGLLRVKVTDANGCVAYGFFMAVVPESNPA